MCLRLMEGGTPLYSTLNISLKVCLSVSESCLHVYEEVLQMDGAAGDVFFLGFVFRYCEGHVHSVTDDVEAGGVVPILSCVWTVTGLGYLDLADED